MFVLVATISLPTSQRPFSRSTSESGRIDSYKRHLTSLYGMHGLRNTTRMFWKSSEETGREACISGEWEGPSVEDCGGAEMRLPPVPGRLRPAASVSGTPPSAAQSPAVAQTRVRSSHPRVARKNPHLPGRWENIRGVWEESYQGRVGGIPVSFFASFLDVFFLSPLPPIYFHVFLDSKENEKQNNSNKKKVWSLEKYMIKTSSI